MQRARPRMPWCGASLSLAVGITASNSNRAVVVDIVIASTMTGPTLATSRHWTTAAVESGPKSPHTGNYSASTRIWSG